MLFKREMIDEFKREAEMVLRIRPHPNIVQTVRARFLALFF
jgi:hypothetical protein